jgi:hypothetical protein
LLRALLTPLRQIADEAQAAGKQRKGSGERCSADRADDVSRSGGINTRVVYANLNGAIARSTVARIQSKTIGVVEKA